MKHFFSSIGSLAILCGLGAQAAFAEPVFNRIASWPVSNNLPAGRHSSTVTSAEIIEVARNGTLVVYTDSALQSLGMIDITDPNSPKPAGTVELGGEPTSVAIAGNRAFAVVSTTTDFAAPKGRLSVVDLDSKSVVSTCDLHGQPDSVAVSPRESFLAIAVENERNENLNDGSIPQLPAGNVTIFPLTDGAVDCANRKVVDLTGLARVAGSDPEPEFVDINGANEIVVTLQENNHIVVIDGRTGAIINHFSAGTVTLENVDTDSDKAIEFSGFMRDTPREPDAVKWLDNDRFVVANEGDYSGGTRGFTIFDKRGAILYDSGMSLEYEIASIGHYPEERSSNRGIEAEGVEVATFDGTRYIFVTAERASVVAVYRDTGGKPELVQLLPSGSSPESAVGIPSRNLLVTANELDLVDDGGARAHVMVYRRADTAPSYPQIRSLTDGRNAPIAWGALSGLAADPVRPGILYAVADRYLRNQPTIFAIDATAKPATITHAIRITKDGAPAKKLDLEGITSDGDGGFWLASEGGPKGKKSHAIVHVDANGAIDREIPLPSDLKKVSKKHGFEGITAVGAGAGLTLWMVVQREWKDDDDGFVKLLSYRPTTDTWGTVRYPLDTVSDGRVGPSAIAAHAGYLYIVERDNRVGDAAKVKKLYRVALAGLNPAPIGEEPPTASKQQVRDLIPYLKATNGVVAEKVEGFAVDASGIGYAVTDNDGLKNSSGETVFFSVGSLWPAAN
jgi:hypothetical protein